MRNRFRHGVHAGLFIAVLASVLVIASASMASAQTESGESLRVLALEPGVKATVVAPTRFDRRAPVELIMYALPNGNTTEETMGRTMADSVGWRFDIQHIAAQTRAFRARGYAQTVLVYLEADRLSWPEWRRRLGYPRANARIVALVDEIRRAIGNPPTLSVTLASHSGGGSFAFGFIEGQTDLPAWLDRLVFLDSDYNFAAVHGPPLARWLRAASRHRLVVMAYDDREIMLDGKKVVSDSGGTWRATKRLREYFMQSEGVTFADDTVAGFARARAPQMELLVHPNAQNRILHTEMIGEMNGYLHALLVGRESYDRGAPLLGTPRAYSAQVRGAVVLPPAQPPAVPTPPRRGAGAAMGGRVFMASIDSLVRDQREAAVQRELLNGNIPDLLRALRTVRDSATTADGRLHVIEYDVMPDYLAVGSNDDFVRIPMTPRTAQAFAQAYGYVLPTRRMVDAIWRAAEDQLDPQPLTDMREASATFLQHHQLIEAQRGARDRTRLVAGIKKDVVVSNRLLERADRVAIYGWHYPDGRPIQPLYVGHVDWYVDYSHGVRMVRRTMRVDGVSMTFEQIATHPELHVLLSDEGPLKTPRADRENPA